MFSWLMHPAMLGFGAFAVSLPIIIHLLNKRRFKIVTWAAMEFLLDADKQNRRRVQVQNLILLLLRCLAMLLLGLLLARPLLPSAISRLLQDKQKFERVVLLDDSLSQRVIADNQPAFEAAKASLNQMLLELAESEASDDWLTVYLTSNLDQPLLANEPVTANTIPNLQETLEQLECSDNIADYPASLEQVRRYVSGQRDGISRVLYVYSDMRQRDWQGPETDQQESSAQQRMLEIDEQITQGFVVDCGNDNDRNLAITSVRNEGLLVANRIVRFNAEVKNLGDQTVNNVRVLMQIDDLAPLYDTVESLAPGQTETVTFRYLFPARDSGLNRIDGLSMADAITPRQDYRIRIEIDRQAMGNELLEADQLAEDNMRFFAARVLDNIPVLLVDGDPSAIPERSETHYLKFLDVFGTGLKTEVISVSELETISLANYRVLFLCNVDEISADRVRTLERWVDEGGSLVFMPGNQVRESTFNATFYRNGEGLSPLELTGIDGDPTGANPAKFEINTQVHPAFENLSTQDGSAVLGVNIFSWWKSQIPETRQSDVQVLLRLNDEANSPAMVETSRGRGNVVVFTIPGDPDWSMLPRTSDVFVPLMIDLVDYLVGSEPNRSGVAIGEAIHQLVDLTAFDNRAWLRDSANEKIEAVARPVDDTEEARESPFYEVSFPEVERKGFYELGLSRVSGEAETTLYAANVSADESNLKRLDLEGLPENHWGQRTKLVQIGDVSGQKVSGAAAEFWPQIVWLILLVLATEQFLGWWFGRNR
ncbi:MAG: BatA domain-containing protein [Pirellulaceae bacterium]